MPEVEKSYAGGGMEPERSSSGRNMEIGDDSMVDILAEQVRLMDIWINGDQCQADRGESICG